MRAVRIRVLLALCGATAVLLGCCYCCCCGRGGTLPQPQTQVQHSRPRHNHNQQDNNFRTTLYNHSHDNHQKKDLPHSYLHDIQVNRHYDPKQTLKNTYDNYGKTDDIHNMKNDNSKMEFYKDSQEHHKNSQEDYKNSQYHKNSQEDYKNSQYHKNSQEDYKNSQKGNKNHQIYHGHDQTYYRNSQAYSGRRQSDNKYIQKGPDHVQGNIETEYVQKGPDNVQGDINETEYIQKGPDYVQGDIHETEYVQEGPDLVHNDTQDTQYVQEVDPTQDGREEVTERSPRIILLLSTWRSGSTFLGELLAAADPDTFYSYEPLHQWKITVLYNNDSVTHGALAFLKDLFLCRLHNHTHRVSYLVRQHWYLRWNTRLANRCYQDQGSSSPFSCSNATFVSQVCRHSTLHVAKVLRLGLRWVLPLLQEEDLDLQVVYLVRDPRAVLRSRVGLPWCRPSSACWDPGLVCSHLHQDLLLLPHLHHHYPHRFRMVLYEALLEDFESSVRQLFAFLQLPLRARHLLLLRSGGAEPSGLGSDEEGSQARGTYGTSRSLKNQGRVWRFRTTFRDMLAHQRRCLPALNLLGLRVFTSATQYHNHRLPVLLHPPPPLA